MNWDCRNSCIGNLLALQSPFGIIARPQQAGQKKCLCLTCDGTVLIATLCKFAIVSPILPYLASSVMHSLRSLAYEVGKGGKMEP